MAATRLVLILLGFLVAFFVTSTNCKTQPNWGLKLFRHSQDWCTTVASCMPWLWPVDVLAILMLTNSNLNGDQLIALNFQKTACVYTMCGANS